MKVVRNIGAIGMLASAVTCGVGPEHLGAGLLVFLCGLVLFVLGRMCD